MAKITFQAKGNGLGMLAFDGASVQFSNAIGDSLDTPALGVPDGIGVVPEPGTPLLVTAAMTALLLSRKRTGSGKTTG